MKYIQTKWLILAISLVMVLQSCHLKQVKIIPNEATCDSLKKKAFKEFLVVKYPQAFTDFNLALQYCTGNKDTLAQIYTYRAATEISLGKFKDALTDCNTSLKFNSKRIDSRIFKCAAEFYLGNYEAAIKDDNKNVVDSVDEDSEVFSLMYDLKYNNEETKSVMEHILYECSNYRELAETELQIKAHPVLLLPDAYLANLYSSEGIYYYSLNNYDSAETAYTKAISFDSSENNDYTSDIAVYYDGRGANYMDNGNFELANKDFTKEIALYTIDSNSTQVAITRKARAESEAGLKQYANAIDDETAALTVFQKDTSFPGNGEFYYNIGRYYWLLNKKDEAKIYFKKVVSSKPDSAPPYVLSWVSFALFFLDDTVRADSNMSNALRDAESINSEMADRFFDLCDIGVRFYDMSRLLALRNKPKEAIYYLELAIANGTNKKKALFDPYYDSIRNTPEFIELMKD